MNILVIKKYPNIYGEYKEANTLLLSIYLNLTPDNLVNKGNIANSRLLRMCNRTLNKYWHYLENLGILSKTDIPKTWKVNPEYVVIQNEPNYGSFDKFM